MFTISGYIMNKPNDVPLEGVKLRDADENLLAITDEKGKYSFKKEAEWYNKVIPFKKGYIFTPEAREYPGLEHDMLEEHYLSSSGGGSIF